MRTGVKITQKLRYAYKALACMQDCASLTGCPVRLVDMVEEVGCSSSYLEQLITRLVKAGFVKGTRGPGGGYVPTEMFRNATLWDIVCAVDGFEVEEDNPLDRVMRDFLAGMTVMSTFGVARSR